MTGNPEADRSKVDLSGQISGERGSDYFRIADDTAVIAAIAPALRSSINSAAFRSPLLASCQFNGSFHLMGIGLGVLRGALALLAGCRFGLAGDE